MAKLYWRIKKAGKWTWRPAKVLLAWKDSQKRTVQYTLEVEEE